MTAIIRTILLLLFSLPGILFFFLLVVSGLFSNSISIMMYRGIALALAAFAAHLLLLALIKKIENFDSKLAAATLALAFNLCFLVIFPVTIDRSVTIYLLSQIERQEAGLTLEELQSRLIEQYVKEYDAVDRRIDEQVVTGNLKKENEKIKLTKQGRAFLNFARVIQKFFNSDKRFLK
jgi:hypothetical protein